MSKPNILFIMSDEHDPAVTGCYGDSLVETPNLDRLAERGITFDACYCNSPLCVPSRLSFTAGQYISRFGGWTNNCWLPSDDYPSVPQTFRELGYAPYLCGKQHYDSTRRYGFTDLLEGDPMFNHATKKGRGGRLQFSEDTAAEGKKMWNQRSSEFYPSDESWVYDHDRKVTNRAIQFLNDRKPGNDPYFLFAGYIAPHFPLIAPDELYQKYKGKVPMPEIPEGLLENQLTNYRALRCGFGLNDLDPEIIQKGRDLYWALTDWFDQEVGRLLSALEDHEEAENTIVIYTSDHGENKGDHGLWWKNCHYEHGSRVPLIVSWPRKYAGGQRRSQVCSLVDVIQTMMELAGGQAPDSWDGSSMAGVWDSKDADWKNFAVSQYYGHNIASGMNMYREGNFKYIYHNRLTPDQPGEVELYDLDSDPGELHNLATDPAHAHRVSEFHRKLVDEIGEDPDEIEKRCREHLATGYSR